MSDPIEKAALLEEGANSSTPAADSDLSPHFPFILSFRLVWLAIVFTVIELTKPVACSEPSMLAIIGIIVVANPFYSIIPNELNGMLQSIAGPPRSLRWKLILALQVLSMILDVHLLIVSGTSYASVTTNLLTTKWLLELQTLHVLPSSTRIVGRVRSLFGRVPVGHRSSQPPPDSVTSNAVEKGIVEKGPSSEDGNESSPTLDLEPSVLSRGFATMLGIRLVWPALMFALINNMEPHDAGSPGIYSGLSTLAILGLAAFAWGTYCLWPIMANRCLYFIAGSPFSSRWKVIVAVQIFSMVLDVYVAKLYATAAVVETKWAALFIASKWLAEVQALCVREMSWERVAPRGPACEGRVRL